MGGEPSRPEQTSSQEVPSAFAPPAAPSGDKGFSWQARSGARVVARHELRGALGPSELAEAAVLGDLALVLEVLGWFVPLVGAAFQGLAVVPFAALAARQRARTAVVAMLAASSVSFLVGGVGIVLQTAVAGTLGLAVGTAYRRRWNPGAAVLIAGVTTAIPVAAISLLAQALSPGLRRLAFAQVQILWRDMRRVLMLAGMRSASSFGDQALRWVIVHWWLSVPVFELLAVLLAAALCARYLWPLLVRLEADQPAPAEALPGRGGVASKTRVARPEPMPVPVALERVSYQYPGSLAWAVAEVSVSVEPGAVPRCRRAKRFGQVDTRAPAGWSLVTDARQRAQRRRPWFRCPRRDLDDLPTPREPGARCARPRRCRLGYPARPVSRRRGAAGPGWPRRL